MKATTLCSSIITGDTADLTAAQLHIILYVRLGVWLRNLERLILHPRPRTKMVCIRHVLTPGSKITFRRLKIQMHVKQGMIRNMPEAVSIGGTEPTVVRQSSMASLNMCNAARYCLKIDFLTLESSIRGLSQLLPVGKRFRSASGLSQRKLMQPGGAGHRFLWPAAVSATITNLLRQATSYR